VLSPKDVGFRSTPGSPDLAAWLKPQGHLEYSTQGKTCGSLQVWIVGGRAGPPVAWLLPKPLQPVTTHASAQRFVGPALSAATYTAALMAAIGPW